MDDKQFQEMAEFEEKNDCAVVSPNLLHELSSKQKQHYFYVVLQNREGKIVDISHYNDYNVALMRGMDKSKETGTYWSIFSLNGKFVDGNFIGK